MKQTLYRFNLFAGLVLTLFVAGPQHLAALGSIEGTFEYAIDAPWRMEPYTAENGAPQYGAIPIQISIHDAMDVQLDHTVHAVYDVSQALELGKVCRVKVTEPSGTTVYTFQNFVEVEATQGAWPWPAATPPPRFICRAWQGDNCASLQDLSQTSEWYALLWHEPRSPINPGNVLPVTVEVEVTRRPETSCTAALSYEDISSSYSSGGSVSTLHFTVPSIVTLRNHLRIRFGEAPLPRFDAEDTQWLYGDLHYHAEGTDNEGESGYNHRGVIRAMGVMGLDFAFATEHASNSEQLIDADIDLQVFDPERYDAETIGDVLRDMSSQRFAFLHWRLHRCEGTNQQAAVLGANGLPPGALSHGVVPQIFLGGELDVIPEVACDYAYQSSNAVTYGNGLTYDIPQLCGGWNPNADPLFSGCPYDALFEAAPTGDFLIRDVQGINKFEYGREHLVYLPRNANLQFSDVPGPNNTAFIPSNTGAYGGASRRLAHPHNGQAPLLPEIEQKGYAFLAHHLNAPGGGNGPDGPPWSIHMLQQAWRSPAILGLQFWNENVHVRSETDSQQSDGDDGVEIGYERDDGLSGPKPVNDARNGFLSHEGLFELIPYDLVEQRWGRANVPGVKHQLHHGAASWDQMNHWGLDPTRTSELSWLAPGEPRRFFMAGGSDAHGDLNYRRAGYYQGTTEITDAAIGSPRNLVQVDRAAAVAVAGGENPPVVYRHETVVQALASGNFAVTDGPAFRMVIDRNQNGGLDSEDTPMGGILHLYGEETLPLLVEWKSTPEFGAVAMIDLYVGVQGGAYERTYAPYRHGTRGLGISPGLPSSLSGYTEGGLNYVLLDDGYWHVTRTATTSLRISGSPDEEPDVFPPPSDEPLPANVYTGVRAMTLDLSAFNAAQSVPGQRFFVRAFARTHSQANCSSGLDLYRPCVERYAFTNPVWAITQPDDGTCSEDPQTLDRDGDGLPDGCDPEPDPVPPVGSACQSSAREAPEVYVDLTTLTACGSFVGARYSTDATQYVLCRAQVLAADAEPYMVCEARDLQGDTLTCLGTAGYVDAVLGMPDYGYVQFTAAADAQGVKRCTSLEVGTFAPLLP